MIKSRLSHRKLQFLFVALVLVTWTVLPGILGVSDLILPSLPEVIIEGSQRAHVDDIYSHAIVTFREIVFAFIIAAASGAILGLIIGSSRAVRQIAMPILSASFAVPLITLIPLFLVTLGIGEQSKIAFGALYGLFPVVFNVVVGMSRVTDVHKTLGKAFGLSRTARYRKIVIPSASKDIMNGLQMSLAITIVAVVSAEMFGSVKGLGYLIQRYSHLFNGPGLWFVIIVTLMISLVLLGLLAFISRKIETESAR